MAGGFSAIDLLNKNSKAVINSAPDAVCKTKDIDINKIYFNEKNFYSQTNIRKKADEIYTYGLLQPLLVTYAPSVQGEYKLITGEQRLRACQLLVTEGHKQFGLISCVVKAGLEKHEERLQIIISNSYRDKSIKDQLEEIKYLKEDIKYIREHGNGKFNGIDVTKGYMREVMARISGYSGTKIAQMEAVNNNLIEEFKEELYENKINFSVAYELSGLSAERQQEEYKKYTETGAVKTKEVKKAKEMLSEIDNKNADTDKQLEMDLNNKDNQGAAEAEEETPEEETEPAPEYLDSLCYGCANWDTCTEKLATVTSCNAYKDRNNTAVQQEENKDTEETKDKRIPIEQNAPSAVNTQENKIQKGTPKKHYIKISNMFFDAVAAGVKPFELRKNDRDYKKGDLLELLEQKDARSTGRTIEAEITYILEGYTGLKDGFCILGIKVIQVT